MIQIDRRDQGNHSILKVAGRLGQGTHELFDGMLQQVLQSGKPNILIDLHGVTHVDQTGCESVKLARGMALKNGRNLRLVPDTIAG